MKLTNIYQWLILLLIFQLVLSSCNSGTDNTYDIKPEEETIISVNEDFNIVFPKGCVTQKEIIQLSLIKNNEQLDHDNYLSVGKGYKLDFSGSLLKKSAFFFISPIRFYALEEVVMGRFDGVNWNYLPINKKEGQWYVTTNRFSTYVPMAESEDISPIIKRTTDDAIEYAKKLIAGNYNSQWDRKKYLKTIGKYRIAGIITMNGGSFLVMATPGVIENYIKGGVLGVGKEISKDIIIAGCKLAINSPDIVSKRIAKNTIRIALEEYEISYSIARKFIETKQISSAEAYKFINNYFGYYKLDIARRLFVRSDNILEQSSDKLTFTALKSMEKSMKSYYKVGDLTEISYEIYEIMQLHKSGLASYEPYLGFNKDMKSIEEGENYLREEFGGKHKLENKNTNSTLSFRGKILTYSPGGSGDSPIFILQLNNKSEINLISGVTYEGEYSKNDNLLYEDILNNYIFDPNDLFKNIIWEVECDSKAHEFGGTKYYDLISLKKYYSSNDNINESKNTSVNKSKGISDIKLKKLLSAQYNINFNDVAFEKKKDNFLHREGKEYLVLFYDNSIELKWLEKKCIVVSYVKKEWQITNEIDLPAGFELGNISTIIDIDNDGVKEFMIFNSNSYQGSGWEERAMFKYIKGDFKTIYHVKDEAVDAQYVGANVEKRKLKFTDYNKDGIIDIIETIYKGKVDENYNQNYKVDKKQLLIFSAGKYQSNQILYNNAKSDEYIINENFDSSPLNSLISIVQKGGYRIKPGIKYRSEFQSECFGFGKSNCPASCFSNNQTVLLIDLQASSYVHMISFSYMELDGDWGSGGYVKVDGQKINGGNFGSNPSNDGIPDKSIKNIELNINRRISRIELIVTDITNKSEIFIDNLIIK